MYESKHQTLAPKHLFLKRLSKSLLIGLSIILISLFLGMWGYHSYEKMSWLDAYLNASMILAGMGPVTELHTDHGKLFAGTYALFSGIIFLVVIAIVLSPAIHRFFHKLHIEKSIKTEK